MLTRLKWFFAIMLLVTATSKIIPVDHVSTPLKPYYNNYMFFVKTMCKPSQYWYPKRVLIIFGDLKGYEVGECDYSYPHDFKIVIDRRFFKIANEEQRTQLMAHELRHCLFQVDHSTDPNNYMAPMMPDLSMNVLYGQIIDDLKKSCP